MPAKYLALKRKFLAEGMSVAEAEKHGARIFNSQRKEGEAPVTGKSEAKKRPGIRKKG